MQINTASLSGEGKLELEGVRPLRHATTARSEVSGSVTRNMSGAAAGGATGDQDWAGGCHTLWLQKSVLSAACFCHQLPVAVISCLSKHPFGQHAVCYRLCCYGCLILVTVPKHQTAIELDA